MDPSHAPSVPRTHTFVSFKLLSLKNYRPDVTLSKGKSYSPLPRGESHRALSAVQFGDTLYTVRSISNVCTCSIQMYCTYVSRIYHMCCICIHIYIHMARLTIFYSQSLSRGGAVHIYLDLD